MSRSVVCGVDGSDGSLAAAEVAARISTTLGSSLVLGYAVDTSAFPHGNELEAEHHCQATRRRCRSVSSESLETRCGCPSSAGLVAGAAVNDWAGLPFAHVRLRWGVRPRSYGWHAPWQ